MSQFVYKPYPHQMAFHSSKARFRTLYGGRRGGKTLSGMLEVLLWLDGRRTEGKPVKGTIITPTYVEMMDIHVPLLFDHLDPSDIKDWNKVEKRLALTNGSSLTLRSADNPEKLGRGRDYDFLWWDEACFSRGGSLAWQTIYPSLLDRGGEAWITTTPKGRDWVYKTFIQPAIDGDPSFAYWTFKTTDNPLIDTDFIEAAKRDMSDKMFRQEILGEVVAYSGLVYPDFNEAKHTKEYKPDRDDPIFLGLDYGQNNPTAVVLIAQDGKNRLYVLDEVYETKMLPDDIAKRIDDMLYRNGLNRERVVEWWWDPSIEEDIKTRIREQQLPFADATNDVLAGIGEVTRRLRFDGNKKPTLFISAKCKHLLDEFVSYSWRSSSEDEGTLDERPEKAFDHLMDALRYVCISRPESVDRVKRDPWTDEELDGQGGEGIIIEGPEAIDIM